MNKQEGFDWHYLMEAIAILSIGCVNMTATLAIFSVGCVNMLEVLAIFRYRMRKHVGSLLPF